MFGHFTIVHEKVNPLTNAAIIYSKSKWFLYQGTLVAHGLRDHTFMTSTRKRDGGEFFKYATYLQILLFLNNRSIVHFGG